MDGMEGRENGKISVRVGGQGKIVKAAETGACTFRADSGAGVAFGSGSADGCEFHSEGDPLQQMRS